MTKALSIVFFMFLVIEAVIPGGILILPMPEILKNTIEDAGRVAVVALCLAAAGLCWVWD